MGLAWTARCRPRAACERSAEYAKVFVSSRATRRYTRTCRSELRAARDGRASVAERSAGYRRAGRPLLGGRWLRGLGRLRQSVRLVESYAPVYSDVAIGAARDPRRPRRAIDTPPVNSGLREFSPARRWSARARVKRPRRPNRRSHAFGPYTKVVRLLVANALTRESIAKYISAGRTAPSDRHAASQLWT